MICRHVTQGAEAKCTGSQVHQTSFGNDTGCHMGTAAGIDQAETRCHAGGKPKRHVPLSIALHSGAGTTGNRACFQSERSALNPLLCHTGGLVQLPFRRGASAAVGVVLRGPGHRKGRAEAVH